MLYHTSPEIITTVKNGLFDRAVCFASSPYIMGKHPESTWVYCLDADSLNVIAAECIFYDESWEQVMPIVADIQARLGVDEETARNLLDQTIDTIDLCDSMPHTDIGSNFIEHDFWLQGQRYAAAVLMGYDGITQRDETGTMWMFSVETILNQTPVLYSEWEPYE